MERNTVPLDEDKKAKQVMLKLSQLDYLKGFKNASREIRRLMDNDSGYQKYMEEKERDEK